MARSDYEGWYDGNGGSILQLRHNDYYRYVMLTWCQIAVKLSCTRVSLALRCL